MVTLGSGAFSYNVEVNWETVPDDYGDGWREVPAVYADENDNVYLFTRGDHPVMVFDSSGNFVKSWGEGVFTRGHGISKGPNNTLYLTDDGDHTVRHCTLDGEVLMTIGVAGTLAPLFSGEPFNRCTHTATDPKTGDIYVSDGYGNSRIHKYSADGNLLFSWGEPGNLPGQFSIAHNICTDNEGLVYLADRENHRIQIFDDSGKYLDQWSNVHRPCGLYIDNDAGLVYVGELGSGQNVDSKVPNIGPRVSVWNMKGELQAQLGNGLGLEPGQFIAPHGICLDSNKNIYVGEVAYTNMTNAGEPVDSTIRSFQRLTKA